MSNETAKCNDQPASEQSCPDPSGSSLTAAVAAIAADMQYKLDKNKRKPCPEMNPEGRVRSWDYCTFNWLLHRIQEERAELIEALDAEDWREAQLECADVANFAMMIHDLCAKQLEDIPDSNNDESNR